MEQSKRKKYLLKNTIIFSIGSIGTKMIGFILVPLYTTLLSTADYGMTDLVATICMVLVPVLTMNIAEAIMRFALDSDSNKNKVLHTGIVALILATIVGLAVIPISERIPELARYSLYIYFYSISLGYSQVFLCYLRGKEKLLAYSIGNIILSLGIAVFNVLFLVVLKWGIEGYFIAYILGNLLAAVYAFIAGGALHALKGFRIDTNLSWAMIKYSCVLIPNSFMWWIINSLNRIMLTAMLGVAANGIFAVAVKIPTLLTMLATVFTQAWMYSAIKEEKSKDKDAYSNRIYNLLVSAVVVMGAGLLMLMKPFLRVYVEASYYEAWKYTPYLVIGFIFMTLGSFIATAYTVHKDSKGFLFSATIGAALSVVLNGLLIPRLYISGAALSTCLSYIVVFAYRARNTRKYTKLKVLERKHLTAYFVLLLMALTMFVESPLGQALLVVEFLCVVLIFKDSVLYLLKPLWLRIRKQSICRNLGE